MYSASCLNIEYYHDIKVIKGRCLIGLAYFGGMPALESFKKKPCLTFVHAFLPIKVTQS